MRTSVSRHALLGMGTHNCLGILSCDAAQRLRAAVWSRVGQYGIAGSIHTHAWAIVGTPPREHIAHCILIVCVVTTHCLRNRPPPTSPCTPDSAATAHRCTCTASCRRPDRAADTDRPAGRRSAAAPGRPGTGSSPVPPAGPATVSSSPRWLSRRCCRWALRTLPQSNWPLGQSPRQLDAMRRCECCRTEWKDLIGRPGPMTAVPDADAGVAGAVVNND